MVSTRMPYAQFTTWCVTPHEEGRRSPFSRLTVCCLGRSAVGSGRSDPCRGEAVLAYLLWQTAPRFLLTL